MDGINGRQKSQAGEVGPLFFPVLLSLFLGLWKAPSALDGERGQGKSPRRGENE